MRILSLAVVALAFALTGCDATAPSASADAAPAYTIAGPSYVQAGDCDTFTAQDASGSPATVADWAVTGSGYLTNETATSAFVLAEYSGSSYTVKAKIGGAWYSKLVRVRYNPSGTYECQAFIAEATFAGAWAEGSRPGVRQAGCPVAH